MLTPNYLTTNQSEERPWADHTLLLEHNSTPPKSRVGHTVLKALVCGGPLYLAKQKSCPFLLQLKTTSPCFSLASVNRGWVSATFTQSSFKRKVTDSHTRELRPRMIHWLSISCSAIRESCSCSFQLQRKISNPVLPINSHDQNRIREKDNFFSKSQSYELKDSHRQKWPTISQKVKNTILPGGGGVGWGRVVLRDIVSSLMWLRLYKTNYLAGHKSWPSQAMPKESSSPH